MLDNRWVCGTAPLGLRRGDSDELSRTHSRRPAGPRRRGQDKVVTKKSHTKSVEYFPVELRAKTKALPGNSVFQSA